MKKDTKPKKFQWDLGKLFSSDNDANISKSQKEFQNQVQKFVKKWKNKNFTQNPSILKKALEDYNTLLEKYGPFDASFYYFYLRQSQDLNNPDIKAKYQKAVDINQKAQNDLLFFELQISKIDKKRQPQFLKAKELSVYRHFLERLFVKSKYLLSEKEEKIINLKSTTSYQNWMKLTNSLLAKQERIIKMDYGKKVKKNTSQLSALTSHPVKKVREEAAKALDDILESIGDVAEAELNSILEDKKTNDFLRGIKEPDEERIIKDDMTYDIIHTMISTVTENFHISKKFYSFLCKILKVKNLHYFERALEYKPKKKKNKTYPYPKAVEIVHRVFSKLDEEIAQIFYDFASKGHIDVYPAKGKRGGAFCTYNLITHPTYILLNYTNSLRDITTLAHEAGHGINNELIKKKQIAINFGTPTSTAEVASTFMEEFVLDEIIKYADEEEQLSILISSIIEDISTIFRQVAFYNFERELHLTYRQKGYLSKKEIDNMFAKHMSSYMGPKVKMTYASKNFWIKVPHFRYYFYVYSYASGLLISKYLQRRVKEDPSYIENVKYFLSQGLSDSPYNIFKKLGINIKDTKIWLEGLKELEDKIKKAHKLAKKLGKI